MDFDGDWENFQKHTEEIDNKAKEAIDEIRESMPKWGGAISSEPPRYGHHPGSRQNKQPKDADKKQDQVYDDGSTDLLGLDGDAATAAGEQVTTHSGKKYVRHSGARQPDHITRWSRKASAEGAERGGGSQAAAGSTPGELRPQLQMMQGGEEATEPAPVSGIILQPAETHGPQARSLGGLDLLAACMERGEGELQVKTHHSGVRCRRKKGRRK